MSPPADRMVPYLWDDAQACLAAGSTAAVGPRSRVRLSRSATPRPARPGWPSSSTPLAPTPVDPPIREVVHLTGAFEETDPLYGVPVTRLTWDAAEALTHDHDLGRTRLAGNLVGASEGRRYTETFVIDPDPAAPDAALAAVARAGPDAGCADAAPIHLHTLQRGRLAWLRAADGSRHARGARRGACRRTPPTRPARGGGGAGCWTPTCSRRPTPSTRCATWTCAPTAPAEPRGSSTTATTGTRSGSATGPSANGRPPAPGSR